MSTALASSTKWTSFDTSLAKQANASPDSSTTSTSATDPLLDALAQTLAQLGYSMPSATLPDNAASSSGPADSSNPSSVTSASSDPATTGAQFLATLYQALALQSSITARNGAASSADNLGGAMSGIGNSTSLDSTSAYRDLGSRIADLANTASAVDDASSDSDAWDYGLVDVDDASDASDAADADALDGPDSLESAVANLNDALQAHVAALGADPDSTVTLSDVLDGLSDNASSLGWQPVGVLVDISA
jgi:hypothetical protein